MRLRRPRGNLRCPGCGVGSDRQPLIREGIREFTHFLCDNPACSVASWRIEWKAASK